MSQIYFVHWSTLSTFLFNGKHKSFLFVSRLSSEMDADPDTNITEIDQVLTSSQRAGLIDHIPSQPSSRVPSPIPFELNPPDGVTMRSPNSQVSTEQVGMLSSLASPLLENKNIRILCRLCKAVICESYTLTSEQREFRLMEPLSAQLRARGSGCC